MTEARQSGAKLDRGEPRGMCGLTREGGDRTHAATPALYSAKNELHHSTQSITCQVAEHNHRFHQSPLGQNLESKNLSYDLEDLVAEGE